MRAWLERPQEEAHLLNPSFCCLGIAAAVAGYHDTAQHGLPLPLTYMILPITLHRPTRDLLPRNRRTSLPMWIQDNAAARVLFYERLMSLKTFTNEAILFGCERRWLGIDTDASILSNQRENAIRRAIQSLDDEPKDCVLKAMFVGKWFADAGPASTVMTLWGVQT
ncbi:MAG: three component ABC system middle component [Planctomycetota bacterium]